jgi:hypothetical protein
MSLQGKSSQDVEFLERTLAAMEEVAEAIERSEPLPGGAHTDRFAIVAARISLGIAVRNGDLRARSKDQTAGRAD